MVFMQMDRDPLLSRISNTAPGRLDRNFFLRLADYGALPLLALLAAQVPSVGTFVNGLVEPVLKALR
jgi:hypothetical protein